MVEDPFKHYVRSYSGRSTPQSQEFLQSFRKAVDAIRAGKEVKHYQYGKQETRDHE